MKVNYPPEIIDEAKRLYLQDVPIRKIATDLGIKRFTTISRWVKQFEWVRVNSPETNKALDDQLEITNGVLSRFRPVIENINLQDLEDPELLSLYLRYLQHQLKLVKAKSVSQSAMKSQSIFEFS